MTMVTRVPQLLVCPIKDHPCKHRDQDQGEDQTQGCTRTKTRTRLSLHQMKELLLSSGLNKSLPTCQNLLKFLPRQKEIKCVWKLSRKFPGVPEHITVLTHLC